MAHKSAETKEIERAARKAKLREQIADFRRSKPGMWLERRWVAERRLRTNIRRFWEETICSIAFVTGVFLILALGRLSGWPIMIGSVGYLAYLAKFRRERSFDSKPVDGTNYADHDLAKRDLRGLDLKSAQFTGAVLRKSKIAGGTFTDVAFSRADLSGAELKGATFRDCRFSWTDFTDAEICETTLFEGSKLRKAKFYNAKLEKVTFSNSGLEFTIWHNAKFSNCHFLNVRFDGADFRDCTFTECTFDQVDFRQADLSTASFKDTASAAGIWWNDETKWPSAGNPFEDKKAKTGSTEEEEWFTADWPIRTRFLPRFMLLSIGVAAAVTIAFGGRVPATVVALTEDSSVESSTTVPTNPPVETTLPESDDSDLGDDSPQSTAAPETTSTTSTSTTSTPGSTTTSSSSTSTTSTSSTVAPPTTGPSIGNVTQAVNPEPSTTTVPPKPEQPNGVSVEPGGNELKVRWAAVTGTGDEVADSFVATASPGGERCKAAATKRTCVIKGLDSSETYIVRVFAKNEVGRSRATQTKASPVEPDNRIVVRAKGAQATERFDVMIGDTVIGSATTTENYKKYRFTAPPSVSGEVSVVFINDFFDGQVDRTLWLDKVIVNGESIEAENPRTFAKGIWTNDGRCGAGFAQTEKLTCGGHMTFGRIG